MRSREQLLLPTLSRARIQDCSNILGISLHAVVCLVVTSSLGCLSKPRREDGSYWSWSIGRGVGRRSIAFTGSYLAEPYGRTCRPGPLGPSLPPTTNAAAREPNEPVRCRKCHETWLIRQGHPGIIPPYPSNLTGIRQVARYRLSGRIFHRVLSAPRSVAIRLGGSSNFLDRTNPSNIFLYRISAPRMLPQKLLVREMRSMIMEGGTDGMMESAAGWVTVVLQAHRSTSPLPWFLLFLL